jgi:hypothetical protein
VSVVAVAVVEPLAAERHRLAHPVVVAVQARWSLLSCLSAERPPWPSLLVLEERRVGLVRSTRERRLHRLEVVKAAQLQ